MKALFRSSVFAALLSLAAACQPPAEEDQPVPGSEIASTEDALTLDPWLPRGGELVKAPQASVYGPSLVDTGRIIAWSENDSVYVRRFFADERQWLDLDGAETDVLSGQAPAIVLRDDGVPFLCRIAGESLLVDRWVDGSWKPVGGPVVDGLAVRLQTSNPDYSLSIMNECSLALMPDGRPVVAWSAYLGSGRWGVYVARWGGGVWKLLGESGVSGLLRTSGPKLVIDEDGRPYVSVSHQGATYPHTAVAIYRWRNAAWQDLTAAVDWSGRANQFPTIAINSEWLYAALAFPDEGSRHGRIHVFRTRWWTAVADWKEVSGAAAFQLDDVHPELAFRDDLRPVIAFLRGTDVIVLEHGAAGWRPVGAPIPTCGGSIDALALSVSNADRAIVGWHQRFFENDAWRESIRVWKEP